MNGGKKGRNESRLSKLEKKRGSEIKQLKKGKGRGREKGKIRDCKRKREGERSMFKVYKKGEVYLTHYGGIFAVSDGADTISAPWL